MILPAPAAALGVEDEWSQLDSCSELLAQHLELAVRRWGQRALSVVDLPPISDVAPSAAELRVAAVLFWAREVESTGLLDFTEALAEGVIRGTLIVQLQVAGHRLGRYYRERQTRLARQERQLLYGRLSNVL